MFTGKAIMRSYQQNCSVAPAFTSHSVKVSESKILICNIFLSLDGNETLHSYRTCKFLPKTEVDILVMVAVSMATN